jgi:hypothetical protein
MTFTAFSGLDVLGICAWYFEATILCSAISLTFTRRRQFFSGNDVMNNVKQEDGGYLRYQLEDSHQPYIWYD